MTGRWIGLTILALTGCGDSVTGPDTPEVAVTVEYLESSSDPMARVTFENEGDVAVLVRCGSFSLERLTEEGWTPARGQTCITNPPDIEIPPGQSHSVEFGAPDGGPQFRGAVRFRLESDGDQWVAYSEPLTW